MATKDKRKGNGNCCVVGCNNTYGNTTSDVSFYKFPPNNNVGNIRRQQWIAAVKRQNLDGTPWIPTKYSLICSEHFFGGKKAEHPNHPAYNPTIFQVREGNTANDSRFQRNVNEDIRAMMSLEEQHGEKIEAGDDIVVKEECLASENSADQNLYQQLVKTEPVSYDEQNGGSNNTSEDKKQETEVDDNIQMEAESPTSEDSAHLDFYQVLIKCESVSDDGQDGGSSNSEVNNPLNMDETNSNTDTDSQQLQCSMCKELFTDKFDTHLTNHINNITGLKCLICSMKFKQTFSLKEHMKSHLGVEDYKCSICEKKFSNNSDLTRHINKQQGIKSGECIISHTVMCPVHDIICSLIEKPFLRRSLPDKKDIISSGRPIPNINIFSKEKKQGSCYIRSFHTSWYETKKWLCGSEYKKSLFCWPCLLLAKDRKNTWVSLGYTDVKNLSVRIKKHEQNKFHMSSCVSLKRLEKKALPKPDLIKEQAQLSIYNEEVKKNRRLLEYLIDVTILLVKQELAFEGHDETLDSVNHGNFREILDLLIKRDIEMKEHIKKIENVSTEFSKTIQNELISCISDLIRQHINSEVAATSCFSILVDDTTDILDKSQCALSIRFVDKLGFIRERFLGFYDVSGDRSTNNFYNLITNVLKPFNYKEKLIAQCYDDASVLAGSINGLQMKIKQDALCAVFTHCSAHRLNLIFQNGTKCIKTCRIFFSVLMSIPTFFNNSAKRTFILDYVVGRRIPRSYETVHVVESEWFNLKKGFSNIIADSTSSAESVNGAKGYLNLFNSFEFAFLTLIFNEIYNISNPLFKILQLKSLDVTLCQNQINVAKSRIKMLRTDINFDTYCKNALDRINRENEEPVSKRLKIDFNSYRDLYFEILDNIVNQIDTRFKDMSELSYFALADSSKFSEFRNSFPDQLIENLYIHFRNIFEKQKLINELTVIYQDTKFENKKIDKILRIFNVNEFNEIFPEAYKLFILIATVPMTNVSVEHNFSCLKRIQNYLRKPMSQERLSSLSLLSIEKELLFEMAKKDNFTELVINSFSNVKDRCINLIYK